MDGKSAVEGGWAGVWRLKWQKSWKFSIFKDHSLRAQLEGYDHKPPSVPQQFSQIQQILGRELWIFSLNS